MEEIQEKRVSKLALISFILITLFLIYTISTNIFNLFQPTTSEGGIMISKTILFSGLFSFILYIALFILNLIAFIICNKHSELKGKWLSIIGMVFSLILIGYIVVGYLSGPR